MTTRRDTSPPDVLFVQPSGVVDHLPGVADELRARGLRVERQDEQHRPPRVRMGTRVVVVTDVLDPRCVRALRMARKVDARTVLLMDGLVEWRNTYTNPRVGKDFLRPAPVDVVCCSGLIDARTLTTLGNTARPTGLPRIDTRFDEPTSRNEQAPILVATANSPAFTEDERERLLWALSELRQAAHWTRTRLIWRLTDGLADELGVENHAGSLDDALEYASAVITTPSTLTVEAMRAGRPCALLHANETPLWSPAAWVWQPVERSGQNETIDEAPLAQGLTRWVDSPERLLRQLQRPTREQLRRQDECLRLLDASSGEASAAELVAETIAEQTKQNAPAPKRVPLRPIARIPSARPGQAGRKRIVSIVPFDHSPIGGVTTWSIRLADTLERRPDLGYDLQTLLVAQNPPMAHSAKPLLSERVSLCVLDPTDDHFVTLANLRRSVEVLSPDLVLPNYGDLSYAVATQLRHTGVPSVAIGHTDCAYYRELMTSYPDWDGAVSVSSQVRSWLEPMAGTRPSDTIVYGVPALESPRRVSAQGPLRIAYVGRLAQVQKRVSDLVPLVHTLAAKGVECELHIVGDGPDREALKRELATTGCVRVIYHGPRTPGYLRAFWPEMDISVLVSEYEGTSITMLEAMACGVVPAVTRVESGVGEWIEEDVTGVTAPVGQPEALARRIAALDADRDALRRIGAEAHRRVAASLGLDQMAERYAALFDRVFIERKEPKKSIAGVTLTDRSRWRKQSVEDGTGEIAWLRARLTEGGYRSIALRSPHRESDMVILPVGDPGPDRDTLAQWRQGGIDVVWSSLLPGGFEWTLLDRPLRDLAERGYRRIAIYGLGKHTQREAEAFEYLDVGVVGFIDDHPPASGQAFGLPAVGSERALIDLKPDAVLLSSDAWEEQMWERSAFLRQAGVHVQSIYASYEDESVTMPSVV